MSFFIFQRHYYFKIPYKYIAYIEVTYAKQAISFKKIYDEVTQNIFDMSNVRIFKEIEKKNRGCLYFAMSSVSLAQ